MAEKRRTHILFSKYYALQKGTVSPLKRSKLICRKQKKKSFFLGLGYKEVIMKKIIGNTKTLSSRVITWMGG